MKLLFTAVLLSSTIYTGCRGQRLPENKVPSVVVNTLKSKMPATTDVDWKKAGNDYEAEVDVNDSTEISFRISEGGKLMLSKQDVPVNEIPLPVVASIQKNYSGYAVDDVERLEKGEMIYYQLELDGKGKREIKLVLSADGSEEKSISYWD